MYVKIIKKLMEHKIHCDMLKIIDEIRSLGKNIIQEISATF